VDAFAGFAVMMAGLILALASRWFVMRKFSDERTMREKGWLPWLRWLCAVPEEEKRVPEAQPV
jgi:hypothetical protein